ncbi:MAG TPA: hypothetical protein VK540_14655 [Polyangiaceae bacterium]|nr:hypothetical protein [Polyangiaceae bacterium]
MKMRIGAVALAWLAIVFLPSSAHAQDNRPPGAAPSDAAPADPAAAPPHAPAPPPTAGAPLPPLPPSAPGESPSSEAPPPPPPPPQDRPRRPWFGGLGYVTFGPFFGDLSTLDTALRSPDAFGASYGIGRAALMLGGGGGAVLFGHLWLGGHGSGLLTAPFVNARGEAILTGGSGAFELGYVLTSRPRMLIIPVLAVGGFGYNLEVKNQSGRAMPLQQGLTLAPGESRSFKARFATVEIGLRMQRLLFSQNGGFIGGFEVGLLRSLSAAPWKSDGYEFTEQSGALIEGVYARVNIGGGGFLFR